MPNFQLLKCVTPFSAGLRTPLRDLSPMKYLLTVTMFKHKDYPVGVSAVLESNPTFLAINPF